jgi:RNA polymerase sigma factor (sigma-70 family)
MEESVLKNLHTFVGFARKRLGDPQLAEDVVQESLVKAFASAKQPTREEDTVAWFYRILRRSIIDLYRRRDARKRAMEQFEKELPDAVTTQDERLLCQCFKRLLPAVPEQYRDLLQRVDLNGDDSTARCSLSRFDQKQSDCAPAPRPQASSRTTVAHLPGVQQTRMSGLHLRGLT